VIRDGVALAPPFCQGAHVHPGGSLHALPARYAKCGRGQRETV